jgi:hypothetical protein
MPAWVPGIGGQFYPLWPVFNIADAAITVGIVVVLLFQKKLFLDAGVVPAPVALVPPTDLAPEAAPVTEAPLPSTGA